MDLEGHAMDLRGQPYHQRCYGKTQATTRIIFPGRTGSAASSGTFAPTGLHAPDLLSAAA
jgi:hypothetical protein